MEIMTSPSTSFLAYVKRIFRLYWTITSAGGVSLIVAIVLASPEMQRRVGPYAWILVLTIFLACFVWVTVSEYLLYRQRKSLSIKVAVSATLTVTILNKGGDALVQVYRELENRGKVPIKNLPQILIGYVATNAAGVAPHLSLRTNPPEGKSLNLLSHYQYAEDAYIMYGWDYQIPQGLDGGEKITYSYELPVVPRSEADAFTTEGGGVVIGSKQEAYTHVTCYVHAPNDYKFVLMGINVKDELQNINRKEIRRVKKSCPPQIPRDRLESVLEWKIPYPLFRHEYECKYRLIPKLDVS